MLCNLAEWTFLNAQITAFAGQNYGTPLNPCRVLWLHYTWSIAFTWLVFPKVSLAVLLERVQRLVTSSQCILVLAV